MIAIIDVFYFERRGRSLLAENAEASVHVSSTPDTRAMTRCPLAILKNNKSGGNRGVDNVVGVVATFPARLRILRVVCVFCVLFPFCVTKNERVAGLSSVWLDRIFRGI